jgi:hypothetical protein
MRLLAAYLVYSVSAQLMNCKVCSSVVQGFRDLQGELRHKELVLEHLITRYCSHSYLSAPQRRVCYYLVPMQGDVATLLRTSKHTNNIFSKYCFAIALPFRVLCSLAIAGSLVKDAYSLQEVIAQLTHRRTVLERLYHLLEDEFVNTTNIAQFEADQSQWSQLRPTIKS